MVTALTERVAILEKELEAARRSAAEAMEKLAEEVPLGVNQPVQSVCLSVHHCCSAVGCTCVVPCGGQAYPRGILYVILYGA